MENIDYFKLLGIVGAIITFIITFFNKEQSKCGKLEQEYFEKLLVLYVNEYMKNNEVNSIRFIKKKFNRRDYFIPSYIFYLVDKGDKVLLHKVLIEDYREKCPNNANVILKTMDNIFHTMNFIVIFIYYIFIFVVGILFLMTLKELFNIAYYFINDIASGMNISNSNISNLKFYIVAMIIMVIILILILILWFLKFFINNINDDYTMIDKKIKGIVEKKKRRYDKSEDKCKYYIN
ncbi:MAG: hypothetical protein E7215_13740 [Clostridium sulfidigenes]|uniref:Uncharacterized protein n=1 Tax=Clostridium sulfidigenes TaxID=318464 RepID=A0A927ZUP1_9CLOT|nr:hypothetical protein [Clostridium sulfidigenes]